MILNEDMIKCACVTMIEENSKYPLRDIILTSRDLLWARARALGNRMMLSRKKIHLATLLIHQFYWIRWNRQTNWTHEENKANQEKKNEKSFTINFLYVKMRMMATFMQHFFDFFSWYFSHALNWYQSSQIINGFFLQSHLSWNE